MEDLQGPGGRCAGVVADGDGLTDQQRVDLVEAAVEAEGAIVHDAAFGLEQKQVVQIDRLVEVADLLSAQRPLLQGCRGAETAMGTLMVFAFQVGPQAAVEGLDAGGVGGREGAEQLPADGAEEPFDLALARRLMGPGVDEGDAELGADQRQVLGSIVGAVVDVQPLRDAAADQRLLEHRQEGHGVLGGCEGGERTHAGGVVEEADEVAAPAPASVGDRGAVHDVAHPQLPGKPVGEPAPVGAVTSGGGLAHQALGAQQPVHGGVRQAHAVGEVAAADGARDDLPDRPGRVLGLERDQQLGGLRWQPPGPTEVGAPLGIQGIEAAAPVVLQPVTQGFCGHARAQRARNGVGVLGLGAQPLPDARRAGRQLGQIGDHAVAEQRHVSAQLLLGVVAWVGIAVVHEVLLGGGGSLTLTLEESYGSAGGRAGPGYCWWPKLGFPSTIPWGRKPSGAANSASHGSVIERSDTNTASLPSRLRQAVSSARQPANCCGSRPITTRSTCCTRRTRRRTQRMAPASCTPSRRISSAAFTRLGACSACTTTSSSRLSVPGSRAAKQSGSRLKVVWLSRQYQRAICVPAGLRRS